MRGRRSPARAGSDCAFPRGVILPRRAALWDGLWSNRKHETGEHFDRAVALNPNDVDITCDRANWLLSVDRLEEALQHLDAALRRDPFPPVWAWEVRGSVLYRLARYEEALAAYQKIDNDYFWIPGFIAACYGQLGRRQEAEHALADFHKVSPGTTVATIDGLFPYVGRTWLKQLIDGLRKAGLRG
jgi:adenylate cyclase